MLPSFHKDRRGPWGDDKTTGRRMVSTLPYDGIGGGTAEDGMYIQRRADIIRESDRFLNSIYVENDHQTLYLRIERSSLAVENYHDNQRGLLVRADIMESHSFLYFL